MECRRKQKKTLLSKLQNGYQFGELVAQNDVAQAIELLVENTFITGTIVEVDGGAHLN